MCFAVASGCWRRARGVQNVPRVGAFLLRRLPSLPFPPAWPDAAVQEERQRNREREGELEFSVSVNEEMPVEKILAAETAVEQKTELHSDGVSAGNSVRISSDGDTRM